MIEKRKGKYRARLFFTNNKGERDNVSNTFTKKSDAIDWESKTRIELMHGDYRNSDDITVLAYYQMWVENYKVPVSSPHTIDRYTTTENHIEKYFAKTKLRELTKLDYQQFINKFARTHSKNSVRKLHSQMHQMIVAAVDDGVLQKDIAYKAVLGGSKGLSADDKYLEADDFETLTAYLESQSATLAPSGGMILVAIHTGCRLAEVAGITDRSLSQINNKLVIKQQYAYSKDPDEIFAPTKNKISRMIDIPQVLVDFLKYKIKFWRDLNWENNPHHLLFAKKTDGLPPTSNACVKELRKILVRCNINRPELRFHDLRHSHVAYLLANGVTLPYISKRLGHLSLDTTIRTYTHLLSRMENSEAEKTVNILDNVGKNKKEISKINTQK